MRWNVSRGNSYAVGNFGRDAVGDGVAPVGSSSVGDQVAGKMCGEFRPRFLQDFEKLNFKLEESTSEIVSYMKFLVTVILVTKIKVFVFI